MSEETNTTVMPEGLAEEKAQVAHAKVAVAEAEQETQVDDIEEENAEYEMYGHSWDNLQAVCDRYNIDADFANQVFNPEYIEYEKKMAFSPEQADMMRIQTLGRAIQNYQYNQNEQVQHQQSMEHYHAEQLQTHFGDLSMEQLADKIFTHNLGAEGNLRVDPNVDSYETIKLKMMTGAAPSPNSAYASRGVEFNSQIDGLLQKHGMDLNASDEEWHAGIMKVMRESPKEFDALERVRSKYYGSLAKRG